MTRLQVYRRTFAVVTIAALGQPATAIAQETPVAQASVAQAGQLPPGMAEVLAAVQASRDARSLEALVLYLQRSHPESQAAIGAWLALNKAPGALADAVPAATPEAKAESSLQVQPQTQSQTQNQPQAAALAAVRAKTWSGEGEFGAFSSTGGTSGIGFVGRFKMLFEDSRWRIGSSGRFDYQKASDVVSRKQIRLTFEPNFKFSERVYVFGLGQFEEDRFQGFIARYSLSGGLGYNLLKREDLKLNIKAGPAMRVTQPVDGASESALSAVALADFKLKLTNTLSYSQEVSTYFDAVRQTYYTLAAVDSQLTGKLKARLSYTLQHETGDQTGGSLTDTTSRLTLIYGF